MIACKFGLVEEGQAAAKETLSFPMVGPSCPELEYMLGPAYHALIEHRSSCIAVFDTQYSKIELPSLVPHHNSAMTCLGSCRHSPYGIFSTWFVNHVDQVKATFAKATLGSTIESPAILGDTLTRLRDCHLCEADPQISSKLVAYNQRLAEALDVAIAAVR